MFSEVSKLLCTSEENRMSKKRKLAQNRHNESCESKKSKRQDTKACRICKETKVIWTSFHKCTSEKIINGKTYVAVYRSECKTCRRVGGKAHSSAARTLMKRLNMTRPPLGTACANCDKDSEKLIFDHDHDTNTFRGWLCYQCNTAIGNLGDCSEGLQRALAYLEKTTVK